MKKIDEFMAHIDHSVDQRIMPMLGFLKKYFSVFSVSLLTLLLFIFVFKIVQERPYHLAAVIKSDLDQLERKLTDIDTTCNILSIASERIHLDFLNVVKFEGSTVGSINLAYPDKWKGPYLGRNSTLSGHFYEMIRVKEGYFIVPGYGVKLPNGYIVGKDFVITFNTVVSDMLKPNGFFNYRGEQLARKIRFIIGDWDRKGIDNKAAKKIGKYIKEFNDAMSFAQNSQNKTPSNVIKTV